ncbi:hypothetical protein ACOMHN_055057 [Nucella lapillus]
MQLWGRLQEEIISLVQQHLGESDADADSDRLWATCLLFHQFVSQLRVLDWCKIAVVGVKVGVLTLKLESDLVQPLLQAGRTEGNKVCSVNKDTYCVAKSHLLVCLNQSLLPALVSRHADRLARSVVHVLSQPSTIPPAAGEIKSVMEAVEELLVSDKKQTFTLSDSQLTLLQVLGELPLAMFPPGSRMLCTVALLLVLSHLEGRGGSGSEEEPKGGAVAVACGLLIRLLEASAGTSLFQCLNPSVLLSSLRALAVKVKQWRTEDLDFVSTLYHHHHHPHRRTISSSLLTPPLARSLWTSLLAGLLGNRVTAEERETSGVDDLKAKIADRKRRLENNGDPVCGKLRKLEGGKVQSVPSQGAKTPGSRGVEDREEDGGGESVRKEEEEKEEEKIVETMIVVLLSCPAPLFTELLQQVVSHMLLSSKGTILSLVCVTLLPLSLGGYADFLCVVRAVCDAVHAVLVHHPHTAHALMHLCFPVVSCCLLVSLFEELSERATETDSSDCEHSVQNGGAFNFNKRVCKQNTKSHRNTQATTV